MADKEKISPGARLLLDFIGSIEAPQGYGTVYGNKQKELAKPLTQWTVSEIINAYPSFTSRFGSSACGKYQFMRNTLRDLVAKMPFIASRKFTPDLQDSLGMRLLERRGWRKFLAGTMSRTAFGNQLAMEWASFPVLSDIRGAHRGVSRGDTYYRGDKLNKVLTTPGRVEAVLDAALRAERAPAPAAPLGSATTWLDTDLRENVPATQATPPIAALPPVTASGSPVGVLSGVWALLQGKPPVVAAERSEVREEVKAEAPSLSKELGGLRWAGILTGFAGLAGGAQDSGLLETIKGTADQATTTAESVAVFVNLLVGLIRWAIAHWWLGALAVALYILVKIGWAVYKLYAQIQHQRVLNEILRRE